MRRLIDEIRRLDEAMSFAQASDMFEKMVRNQFGDIIDVATTAPDLLKRYYRKLMLRLHPDVGGSHEATTELNDVWNVLENGSTMNSLGRDRPRRNRRDADADRGYGYSSRASRETGDGYPIWAMAGYSGGIRNSTTISRNDYHDLNYIKKRMWELSGESSEEWTVWAFDGRYFRGVWTVYGSRAIFGEMAKAMIEWDRFYKNRAVLAQLRKDPDRLYLIWADGHSYAKRPIEMEHESFNANPGNDEAFCNRLSQMLDKLKEKPETMKRSAQRLQAKRS